MLLVLFGNASSATGYRFVENRPEEGVMPQGKKPGPSVKDDEKYEALRREGASKEKAARIANASANEGEKTVGRRGGKAGSYDDWSVEELRERAAELDIEGRSDMDKSELIDALRNH
jgi:hypothetical protein